MSADDLRAIPEACDAAGNRVGWVPVPVAARDALADLIDAARSLSSYGYPGLVLNDPLADALDALNGTP